MHWVFWAKRAQGKNHEEDKGVREVCWDKV
jgi:hypothetical protein